MTHKLLIALGAAEKLTEHQNYMLTLELDNLQHKVDMRQGEVLRMRSDTLIYHLVTTDNLRKLTNHIARLEKLLTEAGIQFPPTPKLQEIEQGD